MKAQAQTKLYVPASTTNILNTFIDLGWVPPSESKEINARWFHTKFHLIPVSKIKWSKK